MIGVANLAPAKETAWRRFGHSSHRTVVERVDRILPAQRPRDRDGPGRPPQVTDAEQLCLAMAQVLLRYNDERHWLRAAPARVGRVFPWPLRQNEYNARLKDLASLMEAALRWIAGHTPASPVQAL